MESRKISADIVAHSLNVVTGDQATSFICTFPRYILAEVNTHRLFTRNSASSRAIPSNKMLKMVQENPFVPYAWQKDHKGMQGTEYFTDQVDINREVEFWLEDRDNAILSAKRRGERGVTKQLVNRPLEPFMWHTALITATEWDNFYKLRSSIYEWSERMINPIKYKSQLDVLTAMRLAKVDTTNLEKAGLLDWLKMNKGQADIHFMLLVEAMWDAYTLSKPKELEPGEWHIPFGDNIDDDKIIQTFDRLNKLAPIIMKKDDVTKARIEIATARCARVSYLNYEDTDDYESDFRLFKVLKDSGHYSPFEHCCQAMTADEYKEFTHTTPKYSKDRRVIGCEIEEGWCRNFKGFIQLRAMIE